MATPWPDLRRSLTGQPSRAQVGIVVKSALAAGLSWWVALQLSDVHSPVLAPLTAIISVQVSVRQSLLSALQRSGAIVAGVVIALAIGDALPVNALTVGLLVGVSLALTELVLHLPPSAARQVPISALIVLTAVISVLLPASRLRDATETLGRLTDGLEAVLREMAAGLREPWSSDQTLAWRRTARTVRTAIGVSVISRGLDDHARLTGTPHRSMAAMGALLDELATAIGAAAAHRLGGGDEATVTERLEAVRVQWQRCLRGVRRRAREAWEGEATAEALRLEGEWLGYGAILVQVDRIVEDLSAPLPH